MTGPTDAALADYERRNKHWLDTLRGHYTSLELPSDLPQDLREMLENIEPEAYHTSPNGATTNED